MGDGTVRRAPGWLTWLRQRPRIYVLFFVVAGFGIFGLLFLGDRGDNLVAVLSLFVAFVGVVPAILPYLRPATGLAAADPPDPPARPPDPPGPVVPPDAGVGIRRVPWRAVALSAGALILGGLVAWGLYTVVQGAVPVSPDQAVTVENGRDLTPEQPARVVFRGTTPDRSRLGLQLSLDDYLGNGDCTTYAGATLVPHLGGIQGRPVEVAALGTASQEPSETAIETGGAVRDLTVDVIYRADPGCRVGLTVTGATFYGRY